jgi:Na+/melibiose symporter-like transporter
MSELFGVKLFGVAVAVFFTVLIALIFNSVYLLSYFEVVLVVTFSVVAATLVLVRLVKSNYPEDMPEAALEEA